MGLLKNRPAAYVVGGVSRLGIWFGRLGYVFSGLGAAFGVITANPILLTKSVIGAGISWLQVKLGRKGKEATDAYKKEHPKTDRVEPEAKDDATAQDPSPAVEPATGQEVDEGEPQPEHTADTPTPQQSHGNQRVRPTSEVTPAEQLSRVMTQQGIGSDTISGPGKGPEKGSSGRRDPGSLSG